MEFGLGVSGGFAGANSQKKRLPLPYHPDKRADIMRILRTSTDMKTTIRSILITITLFILGLVPSTQAVSPPPDGGYPGANTAEGDGALFRLSETDGSFNTAVGWLSLSSDVVGGLNTAVGAGALALNTSHNNTATGAGALLLNTTGTGNTAVGAAALLSNIGGPNQAGSGNTAVGAAALLSNTVGYGNTALGGQALQSNDNGKGNTAVGAQALLSNIGGPNQEDGSGNTAVGARALRNNTATGSTAVGVDALTANTTGEGNTALGAEALKQNAEGSANTALGARALTSLIGSLFSGRSNTAVGALALTSNTIGVGNTAVGGPIISGSTAALGSNTTGNGNTAIGFGALNTNTTGDSNIAVGEAAGRSLTTGNNNIEIGNEGVAGEANTIRIGTAFQPSPTPASGQDRTFIAGIYGQQPGANTLAVVCADDGKLTANASSRRFKRDIKPMDNASEAILGLKPVSFRYNNDSTDTPWFGLIAEDVAEINPDLIARDKEGKPFGVRYDQVNAMLLNEFLKEHRKVQELEANAAQQQRNFLAQQKQIEALTAGLQKVSAQLELSKAAPQTVLNNQ